MDEKIEIRKLVPLVAKISTGKSTLLNVLYNFNFLECKSGISTKFVNILRYNPKIQQSCFFHLGLIKEGDNYFFYKDLNSKIYEGEENIIKANKIINKELYQKDKIDYEDIFYMTEINTKPFIEDESYLENHDLCDIPGLSEYQGNKIIEKDEKKEEENKMENINNKNDDFELIKNEANKIGLVWDYKYEKKNINENMFNNEIVANKDIKIDNKDDENVKSEDDIYYEENGDNDKKTYLSEIFKIIKKYIDGAIILLSIENYKSVDNYQIIAQLKKVIQKPISNFLIILNKMDLSLEPEKDIKECKGLFIKYFPKFKTFNINLNSFIPLSVNKLKNELSMSKNFKDLIYYHFWNYMEKANKYNNSNNISFIDHLKNIIKTNKKLDKKLIESEVNELNKSSNIDEINNEITSIINDINTDFKDKEINIGVSKEMDDNNSDYSDENNDSQNDIDDLNPFFILKFFYVCHKKKKYILSSSFSEETNNLLEYFKTSYPRRKSIFNSKTEIEIKGTIQKYKKLIEIFEQIKNNIKTKIKSEEKEIKNIINEITDNIDFLNIYNVIFIPFLGEVNSGKSTIINDIIGEDILPTGIEECTKRGIIIKYSEKEDIDIRKAIFKNNNNPNNIKYYFEAEEEIICKGKDQVKEILKDLNYKFNKNEIDSFYYIRTKIRLFDELGLDDSLKKMIYLIDLPGFGTKNFFENNIYLKLMNICNTFVFTVKNSCIREKNSNSILYKIFEQVKKEKKLSISSFIKSCLFIFNNDNDQNTSEYDINLGKDDIVKLIPGIDKENINLCFFNAKYYNNYLNNYNYFYNLKETIFKEYKNYKDYNMNIYKYPELSANKKYNAFCRYLSSTLDQKIEKLFESKINKSSKINEKVEKDLTNILKELPINMDDLLKYNNKICQKISFGKEKINDYKFLKESNIEELKKNILKQINNCKENIHLMFKENIKNLIQNLDIVFSDKPLNNNKEILEINEHKKEIIIKKTNFVFVNIQERYCEIIETYINKVRNSLNIQNYLPEKNYKKIIYDIDKEIKNNLVEFNNKIQDLLYDINSNIKDLNEDIKNNNSIFSKEKIEKNENLFPDLIEFLCQKNQTTKIYLTKEIYNELKIANLSINKIYEEKGFKEWFTSAFSNIHFIQNSCEIIINTFIKKVNDNLMFLIEQVKNYFEKIINKIEY